MCSYPIIVERDYTIPLYPISSGSLYRWGPVKDVPVRGNVMDGVFRG